MSEDQIDDFSGLLEGPRARGAFTLRGSFVGPWSLRIQSDSPLTLMAMMKGECFITHDNGKRIHLRQGDVAITRAPGHYTVADQQDRQPTVYVFPGQECRTQNGELCSEKMMLETRTWGNAVNGSDLFLVGSYESFAEVSERLLHSLPPILSVKKENLNSPLIEMLNDEVAINAPGQAAVLDRLLDMVLIAVLRTWFDRDEATPWYQAKGDRVINQILKLIHKTPAHPWTLDSMASQVGVSRAALAKRFQQVIGEPPMTFLTRWRLALAADLLAEPNETIGTIADRVGYSSPYALSSAFKRVRGISPSEHRKQLENNAAVS